MKSIEIYIHRELRFMTPSGFTVMTVLDDCVSSWKDGGNMPPLARNFTSTVYLLLMAGF